MDDKMTEEHRTKLMEFLRENPDAIASQPVAAVDGYVALDKMRERLSNFMQRLPRAILTTPELMSGVGFYVRAMCELEVFLEQGVVTFREDDINTRILAMMDTIYKPFLEDSSNDH